MKQLMFLLAVAASFSAQAQTHKLVKLWETDTIVAIPESVLPDAKKNIFYVSLIDGAPWDMDGRGGIAILGPASKQYNGSFTTGLNAPKGLGIVGNALYAADVSEVVKINTVNGKVEKKIAIPDAKGLNDITVDRKGVVYVSDSRTGKIWQIKNDQPALFLENITGVNGLKAIGNDLLIGGGKSFLKADQNKKLSTIAELPQPIDGIEPVGNGDYLLTTWIGAIYYVTKDGKVETLLDTSAEKVNTADIGYDPVKRIVYVPTFNAKRVVAYKLD
jgi:hypothetical protein